MNYLHIDGFQSRDKTAMLVHKTNSKLRLMFCIIIESNSQKTFFFLVLCSNMVAMTSGENHNEIATFAMKAVALQTKFSLNP